MKTKQDYIKLPDNGTLSDLFYERVKRSKDIVAYTYFDHNKQSWEDLTWNDIAKKVAQWHAAFRHEGLKKGDRVAIMMKNSPDWVVFDQAAFSLGLVVVPIYTNDRIDNICYILENANVKVLFAEEISVCSEVLSEEHKLPELIRVITNQPVSPQSTNNKNDPRLMTVEKWLPSYAETINRESVDADSLATIVYTSGTTGRPKGVMLSHSNIYTNAYSGATFEKFYTADLFLSFLPLSHMFERTAGYYMPMVIGAKIAYARSIEDLGEDLVTIAPTIFVTVPRIFERVYNKIHVKLAAKSPVALKLFNLAVAIGWQRFLVQQKRGSWSPKLLLWPLLNKLVAGKIITKLGGKLRLAISGGAALSPQIAKTFIGLGLTISQGYGLTETSPIISTNKLDDNDPFSVGQTLDGVEVKLGENDELLVKGPTVMMGYWDNEAATKEVIDSEGWLHTGDKIKIENDHIYITGRIKEIIVLSNGEKVPPSDIELAITSTPIFEQVIVIGEARPFLTAIVVLEQSHWETLAKSLSIPAEDDSLNIDLVKTALLDKINVQLASFPGYAKVIRLHVTSKAWNIEDGFITPTLKLKRNNIFSHFEKEINKLYEGH